ncbi:MAG: bifunctional [glutamine synthetase] adenylyltransferase/[glutamine synthetase]-adenylyl-L-tyrosine phosphorylase [Arcanobacterium sp.]
MCTDEEIRRELRRAGFSDTTRSLRVVQGDEFSGLDVKTLISVFARAADPDQGLLGLARLITVVHEQGLTDVYRQALANRNTLEQLVAILGMSSALTDFLIRYPHVLLEKPAPPEQIEWSGKYDTDTVILRRWYWHKILHIVAQDLDAGDSTQLMPDIARAITDTVDQTLQLAMDLAYTYVQQALNVRFTVIAMGKAGARELNYMSDVDLIYIVEPADNSVSEADSIRIGTDIATFLSATLSARGNEIPLWEIDTNLRPEGKDGPLVRSLASHFSYYRRWAKSWEFQALIKARPAAGDMEIGAEYLRELSTLVWSVAGRENFVEDSRAMRQRVESLLPAKDAPRALKLGKGGLRDVEFTVQLLQLVHGRTDPNLRVSSTLNAIAALSAGGYISRDSARVLAEHYRFLRTLEHRIQIQRFRRSHLVPTASTEWNRLARSLGMRGPECGKELEKRWLRVRREVRQLHQEIFYRPLLPFTAQLEPGQVVLDPEAAMERLAAIGFKNPKSALANISALTSGISRTAAIQRHVLPVMLGWMANGPEPDQGLAAFRTISETMGSTSWYMRMLRDSQVVAERLATLISSSRYIAHALPGLSQAIQWLDDDAALQAKPRAELEGEITALISRRSDPVDIALAGRYIRRRELLRAALADGLGLLDPESVRLAISNAGDIAVSAALQAAIVDYTNTHGELLSDHCVIAMGSFGGNELGYASDADLMFVHDPRLGASEEAAAREAVAIARQTMAFLSQTADEPPFPADADLRPEGKNGPLSRSLESYRSYYARWVATWEIQALLRARVCAGDESVGERFIELIDPLRYPEQGITPAQVKDIRAMKARIEAERMPRGVDAKRHLKLGRGSLADVEWTVQLIQLRYAGKYPALRTTRMMPALHAAVEAGLVATEDATRLHDAWELASNMRDWNVLATGRTRGVQIDVLPHESHQLSVIAALMGVDDDNKRDIEERYLRLARQSRLSVQRLFYGE